MNSPLSDLSREVENNARLTPKKVKVSKSKSHLNTTQRSKLQDIIEEEKKEFEEEVHDGAGAEEIMLTKEQIVGGDDGEINQ